MFGKMRMDAVIENRLVRTRRQLQQYLVTTSTVKQFDFTHEFGDGRNASRSSHSRFS